MMMNQQSNNISNKRTSNLAFDSQIEGSSNFEDKFRASFIDSSKQSTLFTSILNIMNTILGAGVLSLPYVTSQFGVVLGAFSIITMCLLTAFSCQLLLKAKNLCGIKDYAKLGSYTYKTMGDMFIKIIIIINNTGLAISYFIVFGQSLDKIVGNFTDSAIFFCHKKFFSLLLSGMLFPFIFAQNMEKMKIASVICLTGVMLYTFVTVYAFFSRISRDALPSTLAILPDSNFKPYFAMASFTNIFLAFTFQFNFFPIYKCMQNRSNARMNKAVRISLLSVLIIYLVIAICGYLTYGNIIKSSFLQAFKEEDVGTFLYVMLYVAFAFSCGASVPFFFFEGRNKLLTISVYLINKYSKRKDSLMVDNQSPDQQQESIQLKTNSQDYKNDNETEEEANLPLAFIDEHQVVKSMPTKQYALFCVGYYCVIVILGVFLNDLGIIFDIIGAIAANSICYLLPCAFYFKLTSNRKSLAYKFAIGIFTFGMIAMIVGLSGIVLQRVFPKGN